MEWILVIAFYAGTLSGGDSVSLTTIEGYKSEKACVSAGESMKKLETMKKSVNYVCVERPITAMR